MSEYDQQVTVVSWFRLTHRKHRDCIWAVVNERKFTGTKGQRMGQMAKLKKSGFKSGVSDLQIAVSAGGYHGLFIEMKDIGKTYSSVTTKQREHIALMNQMGYFATWAAGADEAIKIITEYMERLK